MSRKTRILIAIILVVGAGAGYGYREFNRSNADVADESSAYVISALELIKEFETNDSLANSKYGGMIVSVKGPVKDINRDDRGHFTLSLGDSSSMSSIRCSIDSIHSGTVSSVKRGMNVSIKGNCTGYNKDELLGLDIIFNRSLVVGQ
jgi:hypothetical protein